MNGTLLDHVGAGRFDLVFVAIAFVGLSLSVASCTGFVDRIMNTRQVPFVFARVLNVVVVAVSVLGMHYVSALAVDDARVLDRSDADWLVAAIAIMAVVLLASLFRADEEILDDTRPAQQAVLFCLGGVTVHQVAVVPMLLDGWETARVLVAAGTFFGALLLVLPFLAEFEGRHLGVRSPWSAALVVGVAGSLPFAVANLVLLDLAQDLQVTDDPALFPERLERAGLVTAAIVLVHAVGWVLAWRASVRQALARREVRVLEASLDALLDDSPDWVSVLDDEGRILAAGGRWHRGPVEGRLRSGDSLLDALEPELRRDVRTFLDDARRTPGEPIVREIRFRSADGVAETTELRIVDRTHDPQLRGVILVARSRTEQLAQQQELENQRRIYLDIFERAPSPMFIIDALTHEFVDVNPAVVSMFGYTREELLGRNAEFLVVEEDRSRLWAFREAIHRGEGDRIAAQATHRRADGSRFGARIFGTQFREGGALRRLVMVEDVDTFVREGALRSGEIQLLQTLARSEDIGAWLGAMVDWLGDFPLGEHQVAVLWLDAERPLVAARGLSEAGERWLAAQGPGRLAASLADDAPTCLPLREGQDPPIWAVPVRDAGGVLIGAVGSGPCVGEAPDPDAAGLLEVAARLTGMAAEREVNARVLRSAQRMETLGRVAGGVAHDFNNLLTVILGEADLLREVLGGNEDALGNVDGIVESATRASAIARRLLSMSRNQPQRHDEVPLVEVLEDVDTWMIGVLGSGLELLVEPPAEPLAVACDRSLLEGSLLNLAINASDAMAGEGRLSLSAARLDLEAPLTLQTGTLGPARYAVLTVRDEGPGIEAELLPRVLDPFFTTKAGAGTGLGLPMVANFARDVGGGVDIESRVGEGTVVRLYLPRVGVATDGASVESAAEGDVERILVVEDEPLVGRFVSRSLQRAGYEVDLLGTADEACERLGAGTAYDLVISDIGLPGKMDGIDLARWIARERPGLAVMLSSGYASEGLPEDVRATMLPKPYDARTLAGAVADLLARDA